MPAENEELDLLKNRRWRPLINTLRGAPSLSTEVVLRHLDRCFVGSLRRASKLLKMRELIHACIVGDRAEIYRLRLEHRRQRDRAESYADHIELSCTSGMSYHQAVDAFIHGAYAQIIDQLALSAVPSDNFPTIEDYRHASAIWLWQLEPRIHQVVEQFIADPNALRALPRTKQEREQQLDQALGWSMFNPEHEERSDDGHSISDANQEP
jgi:hypothetical protein